MSLKDSFILTLTERSESQGNLHTSHAFGGVFGFTPKTVTKDSFIFIFIHIFFIFTIKTLLYEKISINFTNSCYHI
ncbi:MAG: hypothetical protein JXR36_17390, partial [Bacteroidales bacterium]|nr:hypothetical protein [Bacteroidales bacterium]